jgi:hypothetical protein
MTEDQRVLSRQLAVVQGDIRTADAGQLDGDQDLAWRGCGRWDFAGDHSIRAFEDGGPHGYAGPAADLHIAGDSMY